MADQAFAFIGDGYVLLAADATVGRSIIAYKHDEDKIRELDSHKLVAACGPSADVNAFCEFISKNVALESFRNDRPMSTHAASAYVRNELATALRKGPYHVDMLLGGVDGGRPELYFLDYLAACVRVNHGAHGYGSRFVGATLDCHWKPSMSLEAGIALARACMKEMRLRMTLSPAKFIVKVITAEGVRLMPEVDDAARA